MEVNENSKSISINERDFLTLKKDYAKAVDSQLTTFEFKGEMLVTNYAKYLIEYLATEFKKK